MSQHCLLAQLQLALLLCITPPLPTHFVSITSPSCFALSRVATVQTSQSTKLYTQQSPLNTASKNSTLTEIHTELQRVDPDSQRA
jgi:hypothetical protein